MLQSNYSSGINIRLWNLYFSSLALWYYRKFPLCYYCVYLLELYLNASQRPPDQSKTTIPFRQHNLFNNNVLYFPISWYSKRYLKCQLPSHARQNTLLYQILFTACHPIVSQYLYRGGVFLVFRVRGWWCLMLSGACCQYQQLRHRYLKHSKSRQK